MIELAIIILSAAAMLGYAIHQSLIWQPMESAPRDGKTIIISTKWGEFGAKYDEEYGVFRSGNRLIVGDKWRPVTKFD